MNLNDRLNALRNVDPDALSEPELRELVAGLMPLQQDAAAALAQREAEKQRLEDEIARLQGRQGRLTQADRRRGVLRPVQEPGAHSSEG